MDISGKKTSGGLSSPDRLWFICGTKTMIQKLLTVTYWNCCRPSVQRKSNSGLINILTLQFSKVKHEKRS